MVSNYLDIFLYNTFAKILKRAFPEG